MWPHVSSALNPLVTYIWLIYLSISALFNKFRPFSSTETSKNPSSFILPSLPIWMCNAHVSHPKTQVKQWKPTTTLYTDHWTSCQMKKTRFQWTLDPTGYCSRSVSVCGGQPCMDWKGKEGKSWDNRGSETREHVQSILDTIATRYPALHHFFDELLGMCDRQQSSQVTQMLMHHGDHFLDQIHSCQPNLVDEFVKRQAGILLEEEGRHVTAFLKPLQLQGVTCTVKDFSVLDTLHELEEKVAPFLCHLLHQFTRLSTGQSNQPKNHKNPNLVRVLWL